MHLSACLLFAMLQPCCRVKPNVMDDTWLPVRSCFLPSVTYISTSEFSITLPSFMLYVKTHNSLKYLQISAWLYWQEHLTGIQKVLGSNPGNVFCGLNFSLSNTVSKKIIIFSYKSIILCQVSEN